MERKTISKKELEEAYRTMTVRAAAKELGITIVAFYELLDSAEIARKNKKQSGRVVVDLVD